MWSGNHKFYIQFSRLLRLQSFRITLYITSLYTRLRILVGWFPDYQLECNVVTSQVLQF
jgi:hypothetical protein